MTFNEKIIIILDDLSKVSNGRKDIKDILLENQIDFTENEVTALVSYLLDTGFTNDKWLSKDDYELEITTLGRNYLNKQKESTINHQREFWKSSTRKNKMSMVQITITILLGLWAIYGIIKLLLGNT